MEFTKEQIQEMAEGYAEEQNSAYTNDYYGFIAGFEKALSLLSVCDHKDYEWCNGPYKLCRNCGKIEKS